MRTLWSAAKNGKTGYAGRSSWTVTGALLPAYKYIGNKCWLVLLDVSPFWQQVIKGFVILLAVVLDRFSSKK